MEREEVENKQNKILSLETWKRNQQPTACCTESGDAEQESGKSTLHAGMEEYSEEYTHAWRRKQK